MITGSAVGGTLGALGWIGAGAVEGGASEAGGAATDGLGSAACASTPPDEALAKAAPKKTLKANRFMIVHFLSEVVRATR